MNTLCCCLGILWLQWWTRCSAHCPEHIWHHFSGKTSQISHTRRPYYSSVDHQHEIQGLAVYGHSWYILWTTKREAQECQDYCKRRSWCGNNTNHPVYLVKATSVVEIRVRNWLAILVKIGHFVGYWLPSHWKCIVKLTNQNGFWTNIVQLFLASVNRHRGF